MSGPAPSVQFSWDGPGALAGGDDGKALCWDNASGRFVMAAKAASAHTHAPSDLSQGGATSGQVLAWNGSAWVATTPAAGVTDHGALTGLGDDDHSIYALLAPGASTRNVIQPTGAAVKILILKGAASQSANPFEYQNSSGTLLTSILPAGSVIGPTGSAGGTKTLGAQSCSTAVYLTSSNYGILGDNNGAAYLEWGPGIGGTGLRTGRGFSCSTIGASIVPITITGAGTVASCIIAASAGQTGALVEMKNSAAVIQFAVGVGGKLLTNQAVTNTNTPSGATVQALPFYDAAGTLLGYAPLYAAPW